MNALERWRLAQEQNLQAAKIVLAHPERFRPGSLLHRWAIATLRKAELESRKSQPAVAGKSKSGGEHASGSRENRANQSTSKALQGTSTAVSTRSAREPARHGVLEARSGVPG